MVVPFTLGRLPICYLNIGQPWKPITANQPKGVDADYAYYQKAPCAMSFIAKMTRKLKS
jgi:hypothetical protein